MDAETLRRMIEDDEDGLLDVKAVPAAMSEDERLVESFLEIVEFRRQNGREPANDMSNVQEFRLAQRVAALRNEADKIVVLQDFDEFGLLVPVGKVESIADILDDDELGLLSLDDSENIYTLSHVPQTIEMPDYVAQRKVCESFDQYEGLFRQCQDDLRSGKRELLPFTNEQHIEPGQFFVLKGVMVFVAHVGEKTRKGGKVNARLHCIFENGTESDMLLRSLACELYKNGRRVSEHEDRLLDELHGVTDDDRQTGCIYVLKSLSTDPQIAKTDDLYKIGYCVGDVKERVKNAANDPTYLMADVKIIETWECYNLNPQKLELLLHRFFGNSCLEIDVYDHEGRRFSPREWFIVPLPVIAESVQLIITGDIINYRYDEELKVLCEK